METLNNQKMLKRIIIILNIIPLLSTIGLYIYIIVFYAIFKKLAPFDPKMLSIFFYEFITYSYIISIFTSLIVVILLIINFILKICNKDFIKNNNLIVWSILNNMVFWIVFFGDRQGYSFWFFD